MMLAGALTACSGETLTFAHSFSDAFGEDLTHTKVKLSTLEQFDGVNVSKDDLQKANGQFHISELWMKVYERLQELNEASEGPTRDAIIETACDSVQSGDTSDQAVDASLQRHLLEKFLSVTFQRRLAAEDVAKDLYEASQSPDGQKRASVILQCYAVDHP